MALLTAAGTAAFIHPALMPTLQFASFADIPQRKTKAVILTAVKSFAVAARLAKGFSLKHPAARGDDSGT
jgi:hypothetical protein